MQKQDYIIALLLLKFDHELYMCVYACIETKTQLLLKIYFLTDAIASNDFLIFHPNLL